MTKDTTLLLDCGSGGKASQRLIQECFFRHFSNEILARMDDAALLHMNGPLAMSTDSYTVTPLTFPGGSIGTLAVHGTVNDVSMLGAKPRYLTCAFILEEGLDMQILEKVVADMAKAATEAGVSIVTGDTKVVPKGMCDKMFINTTGIGEIITPHPTSGSQGKEGDVILVSGSMGNHGLTIMAQREGLSFISDVTSDSAPLNHMVEDILHSVSDKAMVHVLRDPTRGGLATTLNEIAEQSQICIELDESALPIDASVQNGASFLGLDPLYLANEGKLICLVPAQEAEAVLHAMRRSPYGQGAACIGRVVPAQEGQTRPGQVILKTDIGGRRLLSMLEGDQLPRIC